MKQHAIADPYEKMTATPVGKLVGSLAVPTVISMLITNIYNLVDAYFVGKINTSASGAIGIVLVVQAVIQAFGFMFGHGAGSIISRKLGQRDTLSASRFASTSFFLSIGAGLAIMGLGFAFLEPAMRLLGSTETILPYACNYGKYILLAAPFTASSCVMNNIMRYEGRATLATIGLAAGSVLNMIGDPILMFTCNMGIDGAGLSTALSQAVSFGILLYLFLSGRTQSSLSIHFVTKRFAEVKEILRAGFSSLIRQALTSVSTMMLNHGAAAYGDAAVAAMSIVGRVSMFIASIMVGIGQGLQPVAGFNYGAKKYGRVREAFGFAFRTGELLLSLFAVLGLLLSGGIVGVFRDDPAVVAIGVPALRYQCIALLFQPLGVCTNMTFQSIGESRKAAFVATLRSGLYFLPLVVLLPRFIGILGVQCAQAIADALTFCTALPMILLYFRHMPKEAADAQPETLKKAL